MAEQVLLRQANNKVKVVGVAQESTLESKSFNDKVTGQPYTAISGDITIKTGEDETHIVSYFAKELTTKGELNKNFKALTTIMKEIITVADVAQGLTEGEPSKLICQGELALNEYKGSDGEVKSFVKINGKFSPTRHKDGEFKTEATFDIEGIIKAVRKETVGEDNEETGRLKIDLYVPLYQGKIIPLLFVTDDSVTSQGVDYIEENFLKHTSVNLYGNMVNKSKKIERVVESGFGANKTETTYERLREFAVIGGVLYEEGVHDKQVFEVSLLKEALANRNRLLDTIKEREVASKDQPKQTGFGNAPTTPVNTAPQATKEDDGLGDLFGED